MKDWLSKLLGGGIVSIGEGIAGIVDRFVQTADEKAQVMLEVQKVLVDRLSEIEQTFRAELQLKERVMVAELQSGDSYTRRARPTLVYFGLVVIAWNYSLIPTVAWLAPNVAVPPEMILPPGFWAAWGGTTAVWSLGRTAERRGSQSNLTKAITSWPAQGRATLLGD